MNSKRIPIGISDFKKLIEGHPRNMLSTHGAILDQYFIIGKMDKHTQQKGFRNWVLQDDK